MKKFLILFVFSSVPFGIVMGISNRNMIAGLVSGLLFGLLYGGGMLIMEKLLARKFRNVKAELAKEKKIVHDAAANLLSRKEAVGGWLFLTERQLIFKSHKINLQRGEVIVELTDITATAVGKSLRIIKNRMVITTGDTSYVFTVDAPEKWLEIINK